MTTTPKVYRCPACRILCEPIRDGVDLVSTCCDELISTVYLCHTCETAECRDGCDHCIDCMADEVRADPNVLDAMYGALRDEVLAHLRKGAKASYSEGFMARRQVGER